jgi:cation:H+ antiporter
VVGSNIFNIGLILGLTALIIPLQITGNTVRLEWPVMALAAFQMHLLARDMVIDRFEGGFLFAAMVAFIGYAVLVGRRTATQTEQQEFAGELTTASFGQTGALAGLLNTLAIALGIVLLALGADFLVKGAVEIASSFGVSETIIGLTVVAAGTSTPELVTSLVAAWRGKNDIAVANVVGSNIFNVLGILSVTALVQPVPVPLEIIARDNWWMLGITALMLPLMARTMRITRVEGSILLLVFLAYITVLIRAA